MQNKVVTTLVRAFNNQKLATVRFNFRGVGLSSGKFGHVHGEYADLNTIISWVKTVLPTLAIWLAGFSFGAYISAKTAHHIKPAGLISIAPPVNHYDFQTLLPMECPWLVIQGDQDEIVPAEAVQAWATHSSANIELIMMSGVSHFFHGQLMQLNEQVEKWLHIKLKI